MRKWIGLLTLAAGLVACSNEEAADELTIEPKHLDQAEQALIDSTPVDVYQAYELNGPLPNGAAIQLVMEHYVNGEREDPIFAAHFSGSEELDDALVSFAKSPDVEGNTLFIGSGPSGKITTSSKTEEDVSVTTYDDLLEGETGLQLEQPIYAGYYAVDSGNQIDTGNFLTEANELDLQEIEEFEHFYVMTVMITEEVPR